MNQSDSISVKIQVKDPRVNADIEAIMDGLEPVQILPPYSPDRCDLLISEVNGDPEKEFRSISNVLSSGMAKGVFVTSQHTNHEILMSALRAGVREFIPQPVEESAVKSAVLKFFEQLRSPQSEADHAHKRRELIYVIGSKGGVGTTTVAVNLASALVKLNDIESVALIDLNYPNGEIPLFLGIENHAFDWAQISRNISRVDVTYLKSVLFEHPSGVHVLPAPATMIENSAAVVSAMHMLLGQLRSMYDYIVVDGGSFITDISKCVASVSDRIFVVATLNIACLLHIKKIQKELIKGGSLQPDKNFEIIVNRYQKDALISTKDAESSLKKKIFWQIPNNYRAIVSSINQGKSVIELSSGADVARGFMQLASLVSGKEEREKTKGSFLRLLGGKRA